MFPFASSRPAYVGRPSPSYYQQPTRTYRSPFYNTAPRQQPRTYYTQPRPQHYHDDDEDDQGEIFYDPGLYVRIPWQRSVPVPQQQQQQHQHSRQCMHDDSDEEEEEYNPYIRDQWGRPIARRQRPASHARTAQQPQHQQVRPEAPTPYSTPAPQRASVPIRIHKMDEDQPEEEEETHTTSGSSVSDRELESTTTSPRVKLTRREKKQLRREHKRKVEEFRNNHAARVIQQWWRALVSARAQRQREEQEQQQLKAGAARTIQKFFEDAVAVKEAKQVATQLKALQDIRSKVDEVKREYGDLVYSNPSVKDDRGRVRKEILAYDDGLVKGLLAIDNVPTCGSMLVRERRKQLVNYIQEQLSRLDAFRNGRGVETQMDVDQ